MTDQTTIAPLDVWLRETILQETKEMRPLVESNVREADRLMSDLSKEVMAEFSQYKTKVSHPLPYDVQDVLYQSIMGELTRLTVRQNRSMGRKVMTLDVLSHHEGNEARYNFDEFYGPSRDENLSNFVKQYFEDKGINMLMR